MIVDALVVVGENRFQASPSLATLVNETAAIGIEGVVAAPGRPHDYHLGPANDSLAEAAAQVDYPVARLGRVDPFDGDRGIAEAHRCIVELGCNGLFLHPGEEAFPVRAASAIFDVAAEHSVPVVVATGIYALSEPLQLFDVAAGHTDVDIIMTSGGQINISGLGMIDAMLALEQCPNLHVMTNGEYRQDFIERLANDFDPTRVLAASFAPYFDLSYERRRVRNARIEPDARTLIDGANACRLFAMTPT